MEPVKVLTGIDGYGTPVVTATVEYDEYVDEWSNPMHPSYYSHGCVIVETAAASNYRGCFDEFTDHGSEPRNTDDDDLLRELLHRMNECEPASKATPVYYYKADAPVVGHTIEERAERLDDDTHGGLIRDVEDVCEVFTRLTGRPAFARGLSGSMQGDWADVIVVAPTDAPDPEGYVDSLVKSANAYFSGEVYRVRYEHTEFGDPAADEYLGLGAIPWSRGGEDLLAEVRENVPTADVVRWVEGEVEIERETETKVFRTPSGENLRKVTITRSVAVFPNGERREVMISGEFYAWIKHFADTNGGTMSVSPRWIEVTSIEDTPTMQPRPHFVIKTWVDTVADTETGAWKTVRDDREEDERNGY